MRVRVYISGPLTTGEQDVLENVRVAIEASKQLIHLGYAPLCPHLTYFVDPNGEIDHPIWMEIDLPWVRVADAILRLPGHSRGAEIECEYAHRNGLPVFTSIEDLHNAYSGR